MEEQTIKDHVFQIKIEKMNNPSMGFLQRKSQEALFRSIVNFMAESYKINLKLLSKEQREDPMQIFQVTGTKVECNNMVNELEHIDSTKIEEFYGKISNIRAMPGFLRRKIMSAKYAAMQGTWQRLKSVCFLFSIMIEAEVKKVN